MEQIRILYRLVPAITCLVCLGFSVGMCSESDASLIKTYVSSSLPSNNDDLVSSTKLKVNKITRSEWDSLVIKSDVPVMVMFGEAGCVSCRAVSSVLDELDLKYTGLFKFYTFNIDDDKHMAIRYSIVSVPTTIVFKGGDEMARVPGFHVWELVKLVEEYV